MSPAGASSGSIPRPNAISATYPVSAHPGAVATSRDRVWAGDYRDGSLWRLDPATGDVERFTTDGEPRDVAASADKVYVATDGVTDADSSVTRFDAVTGKTRSSCAGLLVLRRSGRRSGLGCRLSDDLDG